MSSPASCEGGGVGIDLRYSGGGLGDLENTDRGELGTDVKVETSEKSSQSIAAEMRWTIEEGACRAAA